MVYKITYHPLAAQELDDAYNYYETQQEGLGTNFVRAVKATEKRISYFPVAWQPLSANSRRALVSRFPYGLIYYIDQESITIIAIAHLHRKPFFWEGRQP